MKLKNLAGILTASALCFSVTGFSALAEDAFQNQRDEVVMLVNEQREAYGLKPLYESELLNQAAQVRAEEIIQNFSHERPDGRRGFTAFTDIGGVYWSVGENIAAGFKTEEAVVNAWMDSEHHRENILNVSFEAIGIGTAQGSDGVYWVQLFTDGRDLTPLYSMGNLNRDGQANAKDAALVLVDSALRGAGNAGALNRMQKRYADMNHDNKINAVDASKILQYSAYAGAGGTEDIETYLKSLN